MEEMSAFIALQRFLNRLRSPTVRMIFEKVKENGFAVVKENGFVFVRSHATMRPSRLLLPVPTLFPQEASLNIRREFVNVVVGNL